MTHVPTQERRRDVRRSLARMRRNALRKPWPGNVPLLDASYMWDTDALLEPDRPTRILMTLDVGYHASGWFANSDYDRCLHMSISHPRVESPLRIYPAKEGISDAEHTGYDVDAASWDEVAEWTRLAFPDDYRKVWIEPPASTLDMYRSPNIWHVRLYLNRAGFPIVPEGEPYSLKPWPDGTSPDKVFR